MKLHGFVLAAIVLFVSNIQAQPLKKSPIFKLRAQEILDSIYTHYGVKGSQLLRENYPFDEGYQASYLATESQGNKGNPYSYLWPFSGTLSAQVALLEIDHSAKKKKEIESKVLPGLAQYYDNREPYGYASYVNTASQSDRFYDDNVWLGIDFTDLYLATKDKKFLKKAEEIWRFVESGMDEKLGGGIYWCEQKKESKNTCSNAPGTVLLVKLYQATKNPEYLNLAKSLYAWTQKSLQDPSDKLYFDNVQLNGNIGKAKFPYNSGQMLQAAVLLYQTTKDAKYLKEAQELAQSGYNFFFHAEQKHGDKSFRLLKNSDVWFIAIMMRGYIDLYNVDKNPVYVNAFKDNLEHAWVKMRDQEGLFTKDWTAEKKPTKRWLLDQAAMAEMHARIARL